MNAQPDLSRRAFFTALPVVTAGLAIPAHAADEATPHWAMLVDTRRCIACQACTMACSMENVSPEGQFRTVVATYAVTDQAGNTGLAVLPRLCNHCEEPPCIPVCPVGATFKRPDGDYASRLIELCGLKGRAVGGACVSEKHSGFIISRGDATASDILSLIEIVRKEVLEKTGYSLECEIRFLK